MNTPLCDFISEYKNKEMLRLHVPGHKGQGNFSESYDITEISGADVLYHETGILSESQRNAAKLFGTAKTLYSAEGSSLCIRGMLSLIRMYAESIGAKPFVVAGRNAHKVFMTASALLDIDTDFICSENSLGIVSSVITAEALERYLENTDKKPVAVYITSPDYLGNMTDIKALSEVCHSRGVLLAVDNAHGAYLAFCEEELHPIRSGADICCDSAHKTLSVLTGGAYLHISKNAPDILIDSAEKAMALFASTSPSYLILASLDRMNKLLSEGYKEKLTAFITETEKLKARLRENGYCLTGNEPLKITLCTKKYGYYGDEFSDILRENGIECEFSDCDYCVLMLTYEIGKRGLEKLERVLFSIPVRKEIETQIPDAVICEQVMSVKEALFAPSEKICLAEGEGRILSSACVSCPPAIPIALCGERLSKQAIDSFIYYGINEIEVIKKRD